MITDYANPRVPLWFRALNGCLAPVATRIAPLRREPLLQGARKRTGYDDFGDERFFEALDVFLKSLRQDAELTPVGRLMVTQLINGLLDNRLKAEALIKQRPEILGERIERPIIVLGLPRTGTTLLQRLLAQDERLRHLQYWESLMPMPLGDIGAPIPSPDPRIKRAEQGLKVVHAVAPLMLSMHELEAQAPDEEIWLMGCDFASMLFQGSYGVDSYGTWFEETDHTRSYKYLYGMLQVLQWYRRAERWLLKSPQHLGQIKPVLEVFPDAAIIQTHRDPVTVTASLVSMATYGRRTNHRHPDPVKIGEQWSSYIETMLRRSVEDRPAGDRRFIDIQFGDFMAAPFDVLNKIYAFVGLEFTAKAEQAMRSWLEANPRGKHGKHEYELKTFGFDEPTLRRRFEFYQDHFSVPTDPQWSSR